MITQCCYLDTYDWLVKVFYEVSDRDVCCILDELEAIDCRKDAIKAFKDIVKTDIVDQGFTYTDNKLHVTFIIIGESSCADEFRNTFDHEKGHAVMHIGKYYDIDPYGELIQYLSEKLGNKMFKIAKRFMCDHCRIDLVNYGKIKVKL